MSSYKFISTEKSDYLCFRSVTTTADNLIKNSVIKPSMKLSSDEFIYTRSENKKSNLYNCFILIVAKVKA